MKGDVDFSFLLFFSLGLEPMGRKKAVCMSLQFRLFVE